MFVCAVYSKQVRRCCHQVAARAAAAPIAPQLPRVLQAGGTHAVALFWCGPSFHFIMMHRARAPRRQRAAAHVRHAGVARALVGRSMVRSAPNSASTLTSERAEHSHRQHGPGVRLRRRRGDLCVAPQLGRASSFRPRISSTRSNTATARATPTETARGRRAPPLTFFVDSVRRAQWRDSVRVLAVAFNQVNEKHSTHRRLRRGI